MLRSYVRGQVARAIRRFGYEVARSAPPTEARRARIALFADLGIDVVLDVGASDGAFAHDLRADGYRGRIVSFEPTAESFHLLGVRCSSDPSWECERVALGRVDGPATINVAGNASSSSLLPMAVRHVQSAPESRYVGVEAVELARLDSLQERLALSEMRAFLKVDVQGYELEVLAGAEHTLAGTLAVECELSFVALYEAQPLFDDVVSWLRRAGFVLVGLEAVHSDVRTGELLQVNGLFRRLEAAPGSAKSAPGE